jgi:PIN domain nuclease of toxin-antitoxin system
MAVLLDTHAWMWSILDKRRLSAPIRNLLGAAGPVLVSVVSIYEVAHKARLGKWPEVAPKVDRLNEEAHAQGVRLVDVDGRVALKAAQFDWTHRDPFDRLIAATAILRSATLISADKQFDDLNALPNWPGRLW